MKCIKDNTSNMNIQLEMEHGKKKTWVSKLKTIKWAWDTHETKDHEGPRHPTFLSFSTQVKQIKQPKLTLFSSLLLSKTEMDQNKIPQSFRPSLSRYKSFQTLILFLSSLSCSFSIQPKKSTFLSSRANPFALLSMAIYSHIRVWSYCPWLVRLRWQHRCMGNESIMVGVRGNRELFVACCRAVVGVEVASWSCMGNGYCQMG